MRIAKVSILCFVGLLITNLSVTNSLFAQKTDPTISKNEKNEFIIRASLGLIDRYVFKEVGEDVATYITQQFKEGIYDTITKAKKFARIMTADIQSISKDKHMRVIVRRGDPRMEPGSDPILDQYMRTLNSESENYGFQKVEILSGNIGYVDFRYFASLLMATSLQT